MPKISLIVSCYNEQNNTPEFVSRAVNVFKVGGGGEGEIVLVDDYSEDSTSSVIGEMKGRSAFPPVAP